MEYSFNTEHAELYGINEAIMIRNFQYWIKKNKSNGKNLFEDKTWTYNSVNAFTELFPFWSSNQINRILNSLIKQEVLITGNFNKMKYDRTKWYAFVMENEFVETKKSICSNEKKHLSETTNASIGTNETIPNTKTTNTKTQIENTNYKDVIAIYNGFCKEKFDAPAKINGVEGKATKEIIKYLKSISKNKGFDSEEAVLNSFKFILNNWDKLDSFLQKQIKLSQINSNLPNIINQLKNGTEKRNSDSIANEILAKYK